jgi:hypothetical protein
LRGWCDLISALAGDDVVGANGAFYFRCDAGRGMTRVSPAAWAERGSDRKPLVVFAESMLSPRVFHEPHAQTARWQQVLAELRLSRRGFAAAPGASLICPLVRAAAPPRMSAHRPHRFRSPPPVA